MWYTPIHRGGGPLGMVLAALALLALETPRAQPGLQAPLSFETGQVPVFVAVGMQARCSPRPTLTTHARRLCLQRGRTLACRGDGAGS